MLDTVGVMKGQEVKVEEIEASHTLGGTGKVMSSGEGAHATLLPNNTL